ncbi:MAG: mannonate dehydratase [Pseudomonadota bacterium]
MKLGLGLYRDSLTDDNFRFARQAGCTHIVAHLTNYFAGASPDVSSGDGEGWGSCEGAPLWSQEELDGLVAAARRHDLEVAALENFNPAFWHDVLLDGPQRDRQLEDLKTLIRRVGKAGIPCIGYNFSIAGVWGWFKGPHGRGGAVSVGFDARRCDVDRPIPEGMVWNMRYASDATSGEVVAPISSAELWQRLEHFLKILLPIAEESGVAMAAHPDDPPVDQLRQAARGINQPSQYDRLIGLDSSPANQLELCLGSVQEMSEGDVYALTDRYAAAGRIAYIHFRNVRGKVPDYLETFVDEGDIDMARIVSILRVHDFRGVLIPDHTPEMTCGAPWHAGMAYALGYMRALLQNADRFDR